MSELGPMAANLSGNLKEGEGTEEGRKAVRALGDEAYALPQGPPAAASRRPTSSVGTYAFR